MTQHCGRKRCSCRTSTIIEKNFLFGKEPLGLFLRSSNQTPADSSSNTLHASNHLDERGYHILFDTISSQVEYDGAELPKKGHYPRRNCIVLDLHAVKCNETPRGGLAPLFPICPRPVNLPRCHLCTIWVLLHTGTQPRKELPAMP